MSQQTCKSICPPLITETQGVSAVEGRRRFVFLAFSKHQKILWALSSKDAVSTPPRRGVAPLKIPSGVKAGAPGLTFTSSPSQCAPHYPQDASWTSREAGEAPLPDPRASARSAAGPPLPQGRRWPLPAGRRGRPWRSCTNPSRRRAPRESGALHRTGRQGAVSNSRLYSRPSAS